MPARLSTGIAVLRLSPGDGVQVLIGHLGGPFWADKDQHAWSVPKGAVEQHETPLDAAEREFVEETGLPVPMGSRIDLGTVRAGVKTVQLWAVWNDLDLNGFAPGTFELEWPPRSGRTVELPELDRLRWADLPSADVLLTNNQRPFLARIAVLTPPA